MRQVSKRQGAFPASAPERAAIRALKNWLLAAPGESAFDDDIVRLRVAAAIAGSAIACHRLPSTATAQKFEARAFMNA